MTLLGSVTAAPLSRCKSVVMRRNFALEAPGAAEVPSPRRALVRTRGPTIIYFGPALRFRQLEDAFRSQALQVARDRRHGKGTIATLVADGAITCGQRAIDRDSVPMLRMTDVVDGHVVVLAPEERHSIERLTLAEDISCGDLALTFGNHPVLDADPITRMPIGPACNVARGKHAGRARFEVRIDGNAAVDGEARLLGQRDRRPHADAHHHEICFELCGIAQRYPGTLDVIDRLPQVKCNAVRLVKLAHDNADLPTQHALQRHA